MKYPVLKSIGAGVLIGVALFAFPLTIRIVGTVVFVGFLLKLAFGHRWHRHHHMRYAWAGNGGPMPPYVKNMSEEDRAAFIEKMRRRGCIPKEETIEPTEETKL